MGTLHNLVHPDICDIHILDDYKGWDRGTNIMIRKELIFIKNMSFQRTFKKS